MRVVSAVLFLALSAQAASAQSPLSVVSTAEGGWSSNISETPSGPSDFYFRHDHALSLRGSLGSLEWQAGLQLDQTRYVTHRGEDNLEISGGLEAALPLAPNMQLRLGYAATREWSGTIADFGGLMVDVSGTSMEHEVLAELIIAGPGRALVVGVDTLLERPEENTLGDLPIAPLRLAPEVTNVTVRIDGELGLSEQLVALVRGHAYVTNIPDLDQMLYLREPTDGLRLAGGLKYLSDELTVSGYLGADTVWPKNAPELLEVMPYAELVADLVLRDGFDASFRGSWGIGRDNPIDGVASAQLDTEVALRLALHERATLSAQAGLSREAGLYSPHLERWSRSIGAGLTVALSDNFSVNLGARQQWVADVGGGDYTVSSINLGVTGQI